MARTNLLNTRTVNFLELVGNGRTFHVPAYQRDYSWQEEQWEDLWNDVQTLRQDRDESHYMGALVVEARSDREFEIIDGQQRLATLSLLALAAIDRLGGLGASGDEVDRNAERARALRSRFIGEKDPASLIESSKLSLNQTDNAFYQDYLVQIRAPLNPRGLERSNRLLWDCFRYFKRCIEADPSLDDGEQLAGLLSEAVGRQLMFILITVEDELNAYTVFETLNARGLELSATDLLKNYLFSRVKVTADLEALHRRWLALIATVQQERFSEFLHFHMQTLHPQVRRTRLFKLIRDCVRSPQDVFALMEALEARAELFAALSDPNHEYWIDAPACRPHIRALVLFRVSQMTPLLFVARERLSPTVFERVLRLVSVISFRYSVVSELNPNALEPAYHAASQAILNGTARTPAEVFRHLESIYVNDSAFREAMRTLVVRTSGQSKRLARYILAELEADASGRAIDPDTDPGTVEYILPEHPTDSWGEAFPPRSWEAAVYRLGNLTLLEATSNRRLGNASYAEKVATYPASRYVLTQAIPEMAPEEWTLPILERRQQVLAQRAVHIWRVDFS
ncbi:MAG: DUF262 domain-containing protein [Chloroflexi bacterium]|nr:DUF262 domain-containing protein [Chloroflexota bacterium]